MRIDGTPFDPHGTHLWDDVQALWTAIDKGERTGPYPLQSALFSTDPAINSPGAALADYRPRTQKSAPRSRPPRR